MAYARKCDRCGSFYTHSGTGFEDMFGVTVSIGLNKVDLCDDCQKFIRNTIKHYQKEEENGVSG